MFALVLTLFLCDTVAHYLPELETPNVGSVLFTTDDLNRKLWSSSSIELLRIRKCLQNIIPPPRLVDTVNEEYIDYLLSYFQNAYTTIKRDIDSPSLQDMMEVVLSDVLGGYLKIWILPVTKYAYYGGSTSLDSALKVFELYENIKTKLNTNGQNWRSPNDNLLNYVAINIALPKHIYGRNMNNPCKDLAYYEKTDKGLAVPVPHIDWDISPTTMFLPLKNQSLVPLNSINSSKSLIRYYDLAQSCMRTQNPESWNDFDERFQVWLINDIIPHLNDSNFYVAFGSILSLLNKTKKIKTNFIDVCNSRTKSLKHNTTLHGISAHLTSKKMLILGIILLLEIVWCIPTLLHIIFSNKKRRNTSRNCFSWVKNKYYRHADNYNFAFDDIKKEDKQMSTDRCVGIDKPTQGLKLFFKPNYKNFETHTHTQDRISLLEEDRLFKREKLSNELILCQNSHVSENSTKKLASKILQVSNIITKLPESSTINIKHELKNNNVAGRESCTTIKKIESVSTHTKESEKTIKQITYSKVNEKCSNIVSKINQEDKKPEIVCPCLPGKPSLDKNKDKINLKVEEVQKIEYHKTDVKEKTISQLSKKKLTTKTHATNKLKQGTEETKQINVKTEKPLLRIKIERPKTEIKLGITTYKDYSSAPQKPSKIPRRSFVKSCKDNKDNKSESPKKGKKLKRQHSTETITRSLDENNVKITNIETDKNKLNISL